MQNFWVLHQSRRLAVPSAADSMVPISSAIYSFEPLPAVCIKRSFSEHR
jgi:hypothetical protein